MVTRDNDGNTRIVRDAINTILPRIVNLAISHTELLCIHVQAKNTCLDDHDRNA